MTKDWLLINLVAPTIKAMADLCEKNEISFVCHIEVKEKGIPTNDLLTYHLEESATDQIKNTLKAAQGKM